MFKLRRYNRRKIWVCLGLAVLVYMLYKWTKPDRINWDNVALGSVILEGRVKGSGEKHPKWIVVTTIQRPTESLKQLAQLPQWKMVVVGDRKTPEGWSLPGVVYLDVAGQKSLNYYIYSLLPFDSYTRKMIGYLYAIEHGAQYIYETDDDNFSKDLDSFTTTKYPATLLVDTPNVTFNPYQHFGQPSVWPRGFPYSLIGSAPVHKYKLCESHAAAIQQGLVNGEPDVDAIFRMTRKPVNAKLDLQFDSQAPVVNLPIGTFSPLNSQNTFYAYVAFWAMVLPTTVSDRATDIYRSYWAQKLLSLTCNHVAFHPPSSYQRRNLWHTNVRDARDEMALYTQVDKLVNYLTSWLCSKQFLYDCMYELTKDLVYQGFLEKRDLDLVIAFTSDLSTIGYAAPVLVNKYKCNKFPSCTEVLFYPWQQKTSWAFTNKLIEPPMTSVYEAWGPVVGQLCGFEHQLHFQNSTKLSPAFTDVLLVVTVFTHINAIPYIEMVYRTNFSHIVYCGAPVISEITARKWKISYISLGRSVNPVSCMLTAMKMNYNVAGYMHVSTSHLLNWANIHISNRNKQQVWISGEDLYVLDPKVKELCEYRQLRCTKLNRQKFKEFEEAMNTTELVDVPKSLKHTFVQCLVTAGNDPTLKALTTINTEIVVYIPKYYVPNFITLVDKVMYYMPVFRDYQFLSFIIIQCMDLGTEFLHSKQMSENKHHFDYIFPFLFSELPLSKLHTEVICDIVKENNKVKE